MEYQVRVTRIEAGKMGQFVEEWKATVARLRRRRGFMISGAWALEETDEFVWVLGWDGDGSFAEADAAYYASDERRAFDPDPARLIVETVDHMGRRIV
ncbi:MAG: NIPSNAP family containing protein [Acidimicrobiia bacterium]|nr:NIPSNAP family containing protein [Acidimicrobiia bacterium]